MAAVIVCDYCGEPVRIESGILSNPDYSLMTIGAPRANPLMSNHYHRACWDFVRGIRGKRRVYRVKDDQHPGIVENVES